jgi:hypothetical protein
MKVVNLILAGEQIENVFYCSDVVRKDEHLLVLVCLEEVDDALE